ncbi:MAG: hypothetical protein AAF191_15895, partial [Verrucomicrobiota bacterium]
YHHFPSKEKLCLAWLEEMHDKSEVARRSILDGPEDAMTKAHHYFDTLAAYLEGSEFRGCPYSNTATVATESESALEEAIRAHKLSIRSFFVELAGQTVTDGPKSQELGDAMFLIYSGATAEAQNLKQIWPVQAAKTAVTSLFATYSIGP